MVLLVILNMIFLVFWIEDFNKGEEMVVVVVFLVWDLLEFILMFINVELVLVIIVCMFVKFIFIKLGMMIMLEIFCIFWCRILLVI